MYVCARDRLLQCVWLVGKAHPTLTHIQVFQSSETALRYIMAGFGVQQESFFTNRMNRLVSDMLKSLKEPSLPLMETKVVAFLVHIHTQNTNMQIISLLL